MRGRLHINGVIVREIRPLDFKNALSCLLANGDKAVNEVTADEWDTALLVGSDLIVGKVTEEIKQAFIQLNACFFVPEKTSFSKMPALNLSRIETDLHHRCANLIERGHSDCWNYGWAFFVLVEGRFKDGE